MRAGHQFGTLALFQKCCLRTCYNNGSGNAEKDAIRESVNQVFTVTRYLFFSLYYYLSSHLNEQFLIVYNFARTISKNLMIVTCIL